MNHKTNAERVVEYLCKHKKATRTEMAQALAITKSALEYSVQKLVFHKMVVVTSEVKAVAVSGIPAPYLTLGPVPFKASIYRFLGKPPTDLMAPNYNVVKSSLDVLEQFIRESVNHGNAQHKKNVHPGSEHGDGGLGPGQC